MNKIIDKTRLFIFSQQKSIVSSALILSVMIVTSRIFGFLRYRTLSGFFSKEQLDLYLASFRVPDLVFEILITGALTTSFIPIFIMYQNNKKELQENISSIINIILLLMGFFIFLLFISLDWLMPIITPGFDTEKIQTIIYFSRLLLVGQLPFLIVGNFLTGISQAHKRFFIPALGPIVYNLSIIISTIVFAPHLFLLAPILGVVVGAFFFLLIQLPILFTSDFSYVFVLRKGTAIAKFMRVIIPRAFTVVVAQIDATIDLILATLLGAGSYTIFYFAQHLQLLPVSVIGVAFGQASLPYLTEVYQEGRRDEFKKIIVDSILNLFFLTLPIMSFFIFARTPLVRLFFGGEKFDWEATVQTAIALSYFSLSIPFHSCYYFITRCFYAFLDTKTPFIVSLVTTAVNTVLSIIFVLVLKFPVWSIAGAFSFAVILNVVLLIVLLSYRLNGLDYKFLIIETIKMAISTLLASLIVYFVMKFLDGLVFDTSYTINVFLLLATGGLLYLILYLFFGWLLNVKEIYLISKLLIKAKEYRRKIAEIYTSYE